MYAVAVWCSFWCSASLKLSQAFQINPLKNRSPWFRPCLNRNPPSDPPPKVQIEVQPPKPKGIRKETSRKSWTSAGTEAANSPEWTFTRGGLVGVSQPLTPSLLILARTVRKIAELAMLSKHHFRINHWRPSRSMYLS